MPGWRVAALWSAMLVLPMAPVAAQAEGAVAIGLPADVAREGVAFGWAVDQRSAEQAQAQALRQCQTVESAPPATRSLCSLVRTFRRACLSVAMDPDDGTPGFGWAIEADRAAAQAAAMRACVDTAGEARRGFCRVSVTECDVTEKH